MFKDEKISILSLNLNRKTSISGTKKPNGIRTPTLPGGVRALLFF